MSTPEILGYAQHHADGGVFEMPASVLSTTGRQALRAAGWRPIYRERPFKARVSAGGSYTLECRACGTQEACAPNTWLHDRAVLHSGGPRRVPPMGVIV